MDERRFVLDRGHSRRLGLPSYSESYSDDESFYNLRGDSFMGHGVRIHADGSAILHNAFLDNSGAIDDFHIRHGVDEFQRSFRDSDHGRVSALCAGFTRRLRLFSSSPRTPPPFLFHK
jgi:hypothetical protein